MKEDIKRKLEFLKNVCTDDCVNKSFVVDPIINYIEKLEEQFKKAIEYRQLLEQDLFENNSNYVISKDKIREKIDELNISDGLEDNIAIAYLKELLEE